MTEKEFTLDYEHTRCFFKCFYDKSGILDNQGNFQMAVYEEVVGISGKSGATEAAEKCKHLQATTCEEAIALSQCMYENLASI